MRAIRPKTRSHAREHIVTIDTDSAPRIMFSGENLVIEDLPVGTRVIYPNRPMTPSRQSAAAIRYALNHPETACRSTRCSGRDEITIAVDDISMPLPIMRTPDVRAARPRDRAARCSPTTASTTFTSDRARPASPDARLGRSSEWSAPKVWGEYWPDRLYNHDGCDPDGMVLLGKTRHGEIVEMNKRVAESDLTIYVNLNFVPMNGGNKSMAVGLCGYGVVLQHPVPTRCRCLRGVPGGRRDR